MPLCAFLWVFGAVALCHAWSPALSSRVLKLGGLVMFREKEREREEMQCCTHSLQFFPVRISATSCLSLLLSLKISVLVLSTCLFSSWLHLPQPIFHSKPALNISEWLTEMLPDASLMPRNVSIFCAALHWNLCCRKHHSHLQVQSVNICGIPLQHFNWNLLLTLLQSALGYSAFFLLLNIFLTLVVIPFSHKPKRLQSYWQRASAYRCESKGGCRLQSFHQGSRQRCTERLSQRTKWVRQLCSLHHSSSCIFRMISFVWALCLHSHTRMIRH